MADHLPIDAVLAANTDGTRLSPSQALALERLAIELLHRIQDDGHATNEIRSALRLLPRPPHFTNRSVAQDAFDESIRALQLALEQLERAIAKTTESL